MNERIPSSDKILCLKPKVLNSIDDVTNAPVVLLNNEQSSGQELIIL